MSGGRVRDYKAEYARRIERSLAKGKTRHQARGHKVNEHRERQERERETYGISSSQKQSIERWCARYKNEDRDVDEVVEQASENGYDWFVNYRYIWNEARKTYLQSLKDKTWSSKGLGYLQLLADLTRVNQISWLYYH